LADARIAAKAEREIGRVREVRVNLMNDGELEEQTADAEEWG